MLRKSEVPTRLEKEQKGEVGKGEGVALMSQDRP